MNRPLAPGELPRLGFRHPAEEDHRRLIDDVDGWFDGRRPKPLLGRAWFVHFASTSWIAETEDGRIAAFLVGFMSPDLPGEAVVHLAATDPGLRRRRIGTAIHGAWLADVAIRGALRAVVAFPPEDRTAVLFYRSLGFEAERSGAKLIWGVPAFADYDAAGVDRAIFVRPIVPAI
ncbi:MAG: GNAT family N-acetyltransferase [Chloroflexota bacterium]